MADQRLLSVSIESDALMTFLQMAFTSLKFHQESIYELRTDVSALLGATRSGEAVTEELIDRHRRLFEAQFGEKMAKQLAQIKVAVGTLEKLQSTMSEITKAT